ESGRVLDLEHAVYDIAGLVLAERLDEDVAQIVVRTDAVRGLPADRIDELVEYGIGLLGRDIAESRHRRADLVHLARADQLQHLGRALLADAEQQYRRPLDAGDRALLGLLFLDSHRRYS